MKTYKTYPQKAFLAMIAIFLILLSNAAIADEKIKLISYGGPGGIFYGALEALSQVESDKINKQVTRMGSCAEIANYAKNTDNPMVTTWEVQGAFQDNNHPCNLVSDESFITLIGQAYWNFCRIPDSGEDGIKDLKGDVRVGVFEGPQFKFIANTLLSGIGSSGRSVPYSSVSDYKAALVVGEIDYILTTMDEPDMECVLTTNPDSTQIENSVSDFYTGPFHDASYTIAILGFNVNREEIKGLFSEAIKTDEWKNGVGRRYTPDIVQQSTEDQYKFISNYESKMADKIFND